jgi:hypothetical protein
MAEPPTTETGLQHGFGRVVVAVYAVFALSASARSLFQLVTKAAEAPVAYGLSALAGLVYVLATFALATDRGRLAAWAIGFELVGVLAVGLLTVYDAALFPDQTVWSDFGQGYGYVPLALPLIGLTWVLRSRDLRR